VDTPGTLRRAFHDDNPLAAGERHNAFDAVRRRAEQQGDKDGFHPSSMLRI
jgi:hypothetical protein